MASFTCSVYYAHCLESYDSVQEKTDITLLEKLNFSVVNPNKPHLQQEYDLQGMDVFYDLIKNCGLLAFRRASNNKISAGVAKEIQYALSIGVPIIELPSLYHARTMTLDETKQLMRERAKA